MDTVGLLVGQFVVAFFAGLLAWAAYSDYAKFTIPNRLCLGIVALYPSYVLSAQAPVDWAGGLAVGMAVFAVGFVLFVLRWTGGGDAKFLAAISLWAGPALVFPFLLITAFAGGMMSLAFIVRGMLRRSDPATSPSLGARLAPMIKAHIPYGVAIAFGGLFVAAHLFKGQFVR